MNGRGRKCILSGVCGVALALPVLSAIVPAALINDNMVLQRDKTVPIWGVATAGNEIRVKFAGQSKTATVAADGTWRVNLDPMKADAEGKSLVITESEPGWFGSTVDENGLHKGKYTTDSFERDCKWIALIRPRGGFVL